MELFTDRLKLVCHTLEDMKILKDSVWKYEDNMGLKHNEKTDSGDEIANDFYYAYLYHQEHYPNEDLLWLRTWNFILSQENIRIGGACFKGEPNDVGLVEIGYGINEQYQKKGFAMEAVGALVDWAKKQKNVLYVITEIEKDNIASIKVAENIGMVKYKETEENFYYRK